MKKTAKIAAVILLATLTLTACQPTPTGPPAPGPGNPSITRFAPNTATGAVKP